jgi:Xaa-Pro aminopeptidase
MLRSNDTNFVFRQHSDFYYLTGFAEPDAVAVFLPPSAEKRFLLFVRPKDPLKEVWTGRRAGVEGAVHDYGADEAYPISEFRERVGAALEGVDTLYFAVTREGTWRRPILDLLQDLERTRPRRGSGPVEIRDPGSYLGEQRLLKTTGELESLRRACDITSEAHTLAMRYTAPGKWEFQIEAVLDYVFRSRGGSGWGYPHIVAGGENATILHYNENDQQLRDGDLLLIDAGAEFDVFSADVTRTFPVGKQFSREQRIIYDIVLRAQLEALQEVQPGKPFDAYHNRAVVVITEGLVENGLLSGSVEELIAQEAYKPFYMHRTGHWLGMDVHDVGLYVVDGTHRPLEPGMVLTVEPGLYFGDYAGDIDPRWKGIGVRIEDDILVTESGFEDLTAACTKDPAEIEKLRASAVAGDGIPELVSPGNA